MIKEWYEKYVAELAIKPVFSNPRVKMIAPDYLSFQLNISSNRAHIESLYFHY